MRMRSRSLRRKTWRRKMSRSKGLSSTVRGRRTRRGRSSKSVRIRRGSRRCLSRRRSSKIMSTWGRSSSTRFRSRRSLRS